MSTTTTTSTTPSEPLPEGGFQSMQEMFDYVCRHLKRQHVRVMVPHTGPFSNSGCRYRLDGMKCAVGCIIPDDVYREEMENRGPGQILQRWPEAFRMLAWIGSENATLENAMWQYAIEFLRRLQNIHDKNPDYDEMRPYLRAYAMHVGLTYHEPDLTTQADQNDTHAEVAS